MARGDGARFLQARLQVLHQTPAGICPVGTSDRRLLALGRHCKSSAEVTHMLADGMAAVAAISDNPQKHVRQAREQWRSLGDLRG